MSEEYLMNCIRKKGGTSIVATVIYVLIFLAYMAIYTYAQLYYIIAN